MPNVIARFHWDCGRMGDLDGLFVTSTEALEESYGKKVYFGEVLGKHSEIYGELDREDIEVVSDDQEFIKKFVDILGGGTISGHNPLDYLEDADEGDDGEPA